jgi:hypothetical protein
MSEIVSFVVDNKVAILAGFAALNALAAIVAKLTPNKKDDEFVAKFSKFLDYVTLSVRK